MVSLDRSTPARKRPLWIGIAVLLVAALAVGAFFLARSLSRPAPPPASPDRQDNAPNQAGLSAPPQPVRWMRYQGYVLPVSSVHGPSSTVDGLATGYSHAPEGALIAGVQILSRLSAVPVEQRRRIAARQVVGPAKQELLSALGSASSPAAGSAPSVAGFRFVSYTGDRAVIELVWDTTRNYRAATSVLAWKRGDWRLYLSQQPGQSHSVSDLSGYIAWSGVN